jgi:tryptophanyl-tRNA synthetase
MYQEGYISCDIQSTLTMRDMLMGLKKGFKKMSKSIPGSAIFMEDKEEAIYANINDAYCPLIEEDNPILDYLKHLIFQKTDKFEITNSTTGVIKYL